MKQIVLFFLFSTLICAPIFSSIEITTSYTNIKKLSLPKHLRPSQSNPVGNVTVHEDLSIDMYFSFRLKGEDYIFCSYRTKDGNDIRLYHIKDNGEWVEHSWISDTEA